MYQCKNKGKYGRVWCLDLGVDKALYMYNKKSTMHIDFYECQGDPHGSAEVRHIKPLSCHILIYWVFPE